jgi:hypothetical protein
VNESQLGAGSRVSDFVSRSTSRSLGPPHLRIVEDAFLKPGTRADSARTVEQDGTLPPGALSAPNDGGWE